MKRSDLPDDRALVDLLQEHARTSVDPRARERVSRRLSVSALEPAQPLEYQNLSVTATQSAGVALRLLRALGAGTVASALVFAGWSWSRPSEPGSPRLSPSAIAPRVVVALPAATQTPVESAPTASSVPAPARPAPVRPTAQSAPSPENERSLLERARAALLAGDLTRAQKNLTSHRTLYPRSELAEERAALHIQVLQASGQTQQARHKLSEFQQRYPKSLFVPALSASQTNVE